MPLGIAGRAAESPGAQTPFWPNHRDTSCRGDNRRDNPVGGSPGYLVAQAGSFRHPARNQPDAELQWKHERLRGWDGHGRLPRLSVGHSGRNHGDCQCLLDWGRQSLDCGPSPGLRQLDHSIALPVLGSKLHAGRSACGLFLDRSSPDRLPRRVGGHSLGDLDTDGFFRPSQPRYNPNLVQRERVLVCRKASRKEPRPERPSRLHL